MDYIIIEYVVDHDKETIEKEVHYPVGLDQLHEVLDNIADRNKISPIYPHGIHHLKDIVDVHIIDDIFWEDEYESYLDSK